MKTSDSTLCGVVLANGFSLAADSTLAGVPKPLLPIANTPVICYSLDWMRSAGVIDVTVCTSCFGGLYRTCLGDGSALDLRMSYFEDRVPRGPAGAARDAVAGSAAQTVIVCDACVIPDFSLEPLLEFHRRTNAALTMVVSEGNRRDDDDAEPTTDPTGVFVVSRPALEDVPALGYSDLKEGLIPRLLEQGERVESYRVSSSPLRVRCPTSYVHANAVVLEKFCALNGAADGFRRQDGVVTHTSSRVSAKANLIGRVLIGPATRIEDGVTVFGPTAIGAGCTIMEGAIVARSIVWNGVTVGKSARAERCVLTGDHEAIRSDGHPTEIEPSWPRRRLQT